MTEVFDTQLPADHIALLHAIRVAGWVDTDGLARWAVQDRLRSSIVDELLKRMSTPAGELIGLNDRGQRYASDGLRELIAHLDPVDAERVDRVSLAFEPVDADLKSAITGFQRARSAQSAAVLIDFHHTVAGLIDEVAESLHLWRTYRDRLWAAVGRIDVGDYDFVASPRLESYHTVWHLLHRDIRLVADARDTAK